jgi:ankyrin repeat protein
MNSSSFDNLLTAIKRDDCKSVLQLLDAGFDPNTEYTKGRTALILAAEYQKPQIVRLLLQFGANVAHRDHDGYDAILTANYFGEYRMGAYTNESQEIVTMIKEHMAGDPDSPE